MYAAYPSPPRKGVTFHLAQVRWKFNNRKAETRGGKIRRNKNVVEKSPKRSSRHFEEIKEGLLLGSSGLRPELFKIPRVMQKVMPDTLF
jgi:hypothetical protein